MSHKKHCLNFNAITKLKSIRVGEFIQILNARCLGLRRVRNYATPFYNFLQNYFTPFSSSQSGEANDESAARHIKRWLGRN